MPEYRSFNLLPGAVKTKYVPITISQEGRNEGMDEKFVKQDCYAIKAVA
jgi:hypothetical protein